MRRPVDPAGTPGLAAGLTAVSEGRETDAPRWDSRDLVAALSMLLFGLCLALPFALSGPHWYTDSLFYEAQKLELQGHSQADALHHVFGSSLAQPLRGKLPTASALPEYAQFYRRRWSVPVLAAMLDPLSGDRSLQLASLLGWAFLAPSLFGLLRQAFSQRVSAVAAGLSMLVPPLLQWATAPLVDSWGLTMIVVALLLALLVLEDLRWLPVWIGAVLIGSLTRDVGLILVPATAWLGYSLRSRRMAMVAATGALASTPALILFPTPLKTNLLYLLNDSHLTRSSISTGAILAKYPAAVVSAFGSDLSYPVHVTEPLGALALLFLGPVSYGLWLLIKAGPGPLFVLMRGVAGAAIFPILLSPHCTGLRVELVLVPAIATGLALVARSVLVAIASGHLSLPLLVDRLPFRMLRRVFG